MPLLPDINANNFSFNALIRLNAALINSMALSHVMFNSWLTIEAVVWMIWNSYPNCGQMWSKKNKHSVYTYSKAWFYCFWVNWNSLGEKMLKTVTLKAPEIFTPTELGSVRAPQHHCIQVSLIVSHNRCTVSLKQWKKFRRCLQSLGLTETKEPSNFCFT